MGAQPNAAARQLLVIALEDGRVPAGRAQQMRHDQPAQRTADDEGAARTHLFPSPLWGGVGVVVTRSNASVDARAPPPDPPPHPPPQGGRETQAVPAFTATPRTCCHAPACNPCWSPPDCG